MKEKLELLKALEKFQSKCPPIKRSADNPYFKSKYALLDKIQLHIKPHLSAAGLIVTQCNKFVDGVGIAVVSKVIHVVSGEDETSVFPIVVSRTTAQDYGSAVSYAKRYSLSGLLNLIIEDEDDDGNEASKSNHSHNNSSTPAAYTTKPWLNEGTDAYNKVVEAMKSGYTLEQVKEKYNVSQAISSKLKSIK